MSQKCLEEKKEKEDNMSQNLEEKELKKDDIQVVVGIDFGSTYSGFSYCHMESGEIITNNQWSGTAGILKTNTILQYDEKFEKVLKWGNSALASNRKNETRPIELFKLNLGNLEKKLKPNLPIDYKKAIVDYLEEMGKLIKQTINAHWQDVDFFKVLLVLTVPAEYSEVEKAIMRACAFDAKLIGDKSTALLEFTTEPEAAAVHCIKNCMKEHDLTDKEKIFMVVDCGGGTVDLTTRKLLGKEVGELTERTGDYCGSSFVDRAFIEYLKGILGHSAVDQLEEKHYKKLQEIVQLFCWKAKFEFTGDDKDVHYEIDLLEIRGLEKCLQKYVTEDVEKLMTEKEWLIDICFDDIKSMFDPVVERILELIDLQLENCRNRNENNENAQLEDRDENNKCSIMFLVGGFSQSIYLQKRIREKFGSKVEKISVPTTPIAAVVRGAAWYGYNIVKKKNPDNDDLVQFVLTTRKLKFTYGIKIFEIWKKNDPIDRRTPKGNIIKFLPIAKRGAEIEIDKEVFVENLGPSNPLQTTVTFHVYFTREYDAKYCDEPGVKPLGKLKINLPDVHLGYKRVLKFGLSFGQMEITATARNETNGQNYLTVFEIDTENTGNTENTEK